MSEAKFVFVETPIGAIRLTDTGGVLAAVEWAEGVLSEGEPSALLREAVSQLAAYFLGERRTFDLPLAPTGTPFQQRVWAEVARVPYGQTRSYLDVANALGNPQALRAVGAANGRNPLPIIIPCHRIVGHDGRLVGYGGGLWRKEWLLRHEGVLLL